MDTDSWLRRDRGDGRPGRNGGRVDCAELFVLLALSNARVGLSPFPVEWQDADSISCDCDK